MPRSSRRSVALHAAPAAAALPLVGWLAPPPGLGELLAQGPQLAANALGVAFVALAVLHPAVRRAAFPLLMGFLLGVLFLRLPQLRELFLGLAEDRALAAATGDAGLGRAPGWALLALALLGTLLWLLARLILLVPGTDQPAPDPARPDRLGEACARFFPWVAGLAPLLAAALVLRGYDPASGLAEAEGAARALMWRHLAAAAALLAGFALLDRLLFPTPGADRARDPERLRAARGPWVRNGLLGIAALAWAVLLAGAVASGWAGWMPLATLYAGLITLALGVAAWWYGRVPWGWPALGLALWAAAAAASLLLDLPGGAGPATALAGAAGLLAVLLRGARVAGGRRPRLWALAAAFAVAWGALAWAAPLAPPPLEPVGLGPWSMVDLRSTGVLAWGWAGLAAAGSLVSFWVAQDRSVRGGVVVTLLVLWAALLAGVGLSDNHRVWGTAAGRVAGVDPRPGLEQYLHDWLRARRAAGLGGAPETAAPLVAVAAHGGGLRAAVWTALALDRLERAQPRFRESVFAVASVSGGSLGALLWRAKAPSPGPAAPPGPDLAAALNRDFLAAAIGGLLVADLPQSLVPILLGSRARAAADAGVPDRQRLLETAWLRAAGGRLGAARRPRDLLEALPPAAPGTPALLMVAADADTGRRWIASNVCVDANVFKEAVDTLVEKRRRRPRDGENPDFGPECPSGPVRPDAAPVPVLALPAVAAAGLSARFPYVSPAGRMPGGATVVDGGLFEATGAETVAEVLRAVGNWCSPTERDRTALPPGILRCALGPDRSVHEPDAAAAAPRPEDTVYVRPMSLQLVNEPMEGPAAVDPAGLRLALPELLGPVIALNASRSGRGFAAWGNLEDGTLYNGAQGPDDPRRRRFDPTARVEIAVNGTRTRVPLTWTLSEGSQRAMGDRLDCIVNLVASSPACGPRGSDREVVELRRWLARLFVRPAGAASPPLAAPQAAPQAGLAPPGN